MRRRVMFGRQPAARGVRRRVVVVDVAVAVASVVAVVRRRDARGDERIARVGPAVVDAPRRRR